MTASSCASSAQCTVPTACEQGGGDLFLRFGDGGILAAQTLTPRRTVAGRFGMARMMAASVAQVLLEKANRLAGGDGEEGAVARIFAGSLGRIADHDLRLDRQHDHVGDEGGGDLAGRSHKNYLSS